jgi:hypothetical protein
MFATANISFFNFCWQPNQPLTVTVQAFSGLAANELKAKR